MRLIKLDLDFFKRVFFLAVMLWSNQTCLSSSQILSLVYSLWLKTQSLADKLSVDVGGCHRQVFIKALLRMVGIRKRTLVAFIRFSKPVKSIVELSVFHHNCPSLKKKKKRKAFLHSVWQQSAWLNKICPLRIKQHRISWILACCGSNLRLLPCPGSVPYAAAFFGGGWGDNGMMHCCKVW